MLRYAAMMLIAGLTVVTVLPGLARADGDIEGLMKIIAGGKGGAHKVLKKLLAAPELNAAAGKKDKKAADAAYGKLSESCEVCHEAHR